MEVTEIRKLVSTRPFRPLIFHLKDGGSRLISHPTLIVTNNIVVAVDERNEAVYVTPEAISSISYQKRGTLPMRSCKAAAHKR